jgi:PAS domain S-box-containing protein
MANSNPFRTGKIAKRRVHSLGARSKSSADATDRAEPVSHRITRQTSDYSKHIIQTINYPLAVLDKDFRVTLANPSFRRLFNAAETGFNGTVFPYLRRSGANAAKLRADLRAVLTRREKMKSVEFKFETKGHLRIFLINAQPLFGGELSRLILLSLEDITERHEAEEVREHLVAELGKLAHELEDRVAKRSAELQEANAKLQKLSARLLEAQERERRHLARELHDEIGQQITCLQILTEQQLAIAPPTLKKALNESRRATSELLQTVRQLSSELRPQLLDDFGALAALEWHIRRFQKRTGIQVSLEKKHFRDELLNSFLRNVLFRAAQEALTNVARHAHASKVEIQLGTRKGVCQLRVRDKGAGFNVKEALHQKKSFGLSAMQERVFLAGGTLRFDSAPGKGTTVTIELPLSSPHTNEFDTDHLPETS